ncbi:MAG TPA: NAD(P)H-dependent oxidoreductase subunit E, partial [Dehalococcoidia bacterium]|nr:NAD(P)H-dependent oxidoreductase subunit E [Dehalococcoidia bacterium]
MDLHLIPQAAASDSERAAVDALLGPPEEGWESSRQNAGRDLVLGFSGQKARKQRHLLLPALQALQARVGYLTPGGLNYVCQRLEVPPAEAYGVASFYALLNLEPTPPRVAHVCDDLACRMKGALDVCRALEERLG